MIGRMTGETTTSSFVPASIEMANKALDRSQRAAFAIGMVTGILLKFAPKIRPDYHSSRLHFALDR
jgi:hypothetical protein